MFSSQKHLKKRTPEGGVDRPEFIAQLAKEFIATTNIEAKEQVIANLANFSYDPINYPHLKKSFVLELFLQTLRNINESLVVHATAGICNLCNAPEFQPFILQPEALGNLKSLIQSENAHCDIKANILTTFYLIITQNPYSKGLICSPDLLSAVSKLRSSTCSNLGNVATLFMTDFATRVEEVRVF